MSTISKARIRIFDYWQIQEPSLESQPPVRRASELRFGDDLISQAQKLISNVTQFLESKQDYKKKFDDLRAQVDDLLTTLHQSCNSEIEDEAKAEHNIKIYRANLKKLYVTLRNAKLLENSIENYFQTANLANYDPTITQLSFTETSQVMHGRLDSSIKSLQRAMHLLIQAQKLVDSGKQLSSIFGKEHTPTFCQERLEQHLQHENLVKIHFLMIFQLEQLQSLVNQLKQFINVSEGEYLKYQLVLDCIFLMKFESEQMRKQLDQVEQELDHACFHPNQTDYRALVAKNDQRTKDWQYNTRIYQANLENFTRVNVETNMFHYSQLKARFVEHFDDFTHGIQRHQSNHVSLLFLLDRQSLLTDIQRKIELTKKINEADRRLSLSIYNESSEHILPPDCPPLVHLKDNLLSEIELLLVNNGIAYNKRARERVTLEHDIIRHQSIIQAIEATPPYQQYAFIAENLNNINASAFQLDNIMADQQRFTLKAKQSEQAFRNKLRTMNSYRLALLYATVIAKDKNFRQKLQEFESIKDKQGFQDLPVKFQSILFNYINDIRIIQDSRNIQKNLQQELEKVTQQLKDSLTKSKLRGNIDSQLQKSFQHLHGVWLQLYHRYLRKISAFGQELILNRLQQISKTIVQCVRKSLPEESQLINRRTMDIDKSVFFTHRILNELLSLIKASSSKESLKILNIMQILEEAFRSLDYDFISKTAGGKISEIVKLTLLEQYLGQIYGKGNLWRAVRTLRWTGYLQSVSELYSSSSLTKEVILQSLLRLQLQMNSVMIAWKQNDQNKPALAERVPMLVKQMRKYPLTLAAKHDISGFVAIWRYDQIIEELKQTLKPRSQIIAIANIFVNISELKDARKACEGSYEAYENVVVKEKKSIEEYFGNVKNLFRPKIDAISRQIELATKNFLNRDESVSLTRAIQALCKKSQ